MYVCICNGHRSSDIRDAAKKGSGGAREIYADLGKPVQCGCCLEYANQLIEEVHATQKPRGSVAAQPAQAEPALTGS